MEVATVGLHLSVWRLVSELEEIIKADEIEVEEDTEEN